MFNALIISLPSPVNSSSNHSIIIRITVVIRRKYYIQQTAISELSTIRNSTYSCKIRIKTVFIIISIIIKCKWNLSNSVSPIRYTFNFYKKIPIARLSFGFPIPRAVRSIR